VSIKKRNSKQEHFLSSLSGTINTKTLPDNTVSAHTTGCQPNFSVHKNIVYKQSTQASPVLNLLVFQTNTPSTAAPLVRNITNNSYDFFPA
jgi:hypothetical protein